MVRRMENWLQDIFPGEEGLYKQFQNLKGRELSIVACAVLDSALSEVILKRFHDHTKEAESFLGIDGEALAPAGSLGAKIQLALLLDIIQSEDATAFRLLKGIRNDFAHKVKVTYTSNFIYKRTKALCELIIAKHKRLIALGIIKGKTDHLEDILKLLPTQEEASEALILSVLAIYQFYFYHVVNSMHRLDPFASKKVSVD